MPPFLLSGNIDPGASPARIKKPGGGGIPGYCGLPSTEILITDAMFSAASAGDYIITPENAVQKVGTAGYRWGDPATLAGLGGLTTGKYYAEYRIFHADPDKPKSWVDYGSGYNGVEPYGFGVSLQQYTPNTGTDAACTFQLYYQAGSGATRSNLLDAGGGAGVVFRKAPTECQIVGMAFDLDAAKVYCHVDGTWLWRNASEGGEPSGGVGFNMFSLATAAFYMVGMGWTATNAPDVLDQKSGPSVPTLTPVGYTSLT